LNEATARRSDPSETLVQLTVKALLGHIRDNQLKVGDQLPSELEFTRLLEVSRTVIREAFRALAALKIIEVGVGRRARVAAVDASVMSLTLVNALRTDQLTMQQVWDVRRTIEMRTVVLACMHRTERDARDILQLTELMRDTVDDLPTMTEYDIEFHVAIARATRNPLFPILVSSLTSAIRETNPIVWQVRTKRAEQMEVVDWHRNIAEAINDRNTIGAETAMSQHFDEATRGLVSAGFN